MLTGPALETYDAVPKSNVTDVTCPATTRLTSNSKMARSASVVTAATHGLNPPVVSVSKLPSAPASRASPHDREVQALVPDVGSSSTIVTTPVALAMLTPPCGRDRLTLNVSSPSVKVSP